ncbi:MAG TPA: DUF6398 domain-containing protein, partial [Methanospirillum sp.]|uniref:DUF6398 domain-containing protein n=1 Tax=Methanospirillum sp. TaxID=45200 RepID=UPI002D0337E5
MRYNAMLDHYPTAFPRDSVPAFDLTGAWVNNFTKSPEFQEFEEEDIEYVRDIVTVLTGFLLYYQDCTPSEWTMDKVERCLMVDFPRSLFRDEEYIDSFPEVLIQFFRYLHRSKSLPKANTIAKGIETRKYDFYEMMDDPELYSMRKALLITAEDEGVDPDDSEEVLKYFLKTGERMMEGVDPKVTKALGFILSSWVLPFSDSRYVSDLDQVTGSDVIEVLSTMAGLLVEENPNPNEWNASDIFNSIENNLIPCPMDPRTKKFIIPIAHAFFTFLAKKNLQPNALEIAEAILPLQERVISESSDIHGFMMGILAKHLLRSGIDIDDDEKIRAFLEMHGEKIFIDMLQSGDRDQVQQIAQLVASKGIDVLLPSGGSDKSPRIPKEQQEKYEAVITLTDDFCKERLDGEYATICRAVAGKLARKRDSKFSRGKSDIWAAGIVYAVGQMNFLFDSSFEPFQSADDICDFFGTSKSTTSQKAKLIRDSIGMNDYWDSEFSTSRMKNLDPFK